MIVDDFPIPLDDPKNEGEVPIHVLAFSFEVPFSENVSR